MVNLIGLFQKVIDAVRLNTINHCMKTPSSFTVIIFLSSFWFLTYCSSTAEEEREKCGRTALEFAVNNPAGVCVTYSNFPPTSYQYEENLNLCLLYSIAYYLCGQKKGKPITIQLDPFLAQKKDSKEKKIMRENQIIGWLLLFSYSENRKK